MIRSIPQRFLHYRVASKVAITISIMLFPIFSFADNEASEFINAISLRYNIEEIQPSLAAYVAKSEARWFDDFSKGRNTVEVEIRHAISPRLILGYSQQTLRAIHTGEAAAYRCIVFLCGFFSESILSGLSSNERIQYGLNENEIWIEVPLSLFTSARLHVLGGINLTEMNISVSNALETEHRDFLIPLVLLGLDFHYPLSDRFSLDVKFKSQYLEVRRFKGRTFDSYLAARYRVSPRITLAGGMRVASWKFSSRTSTSIDLGISQQSPFLEISLNY